MEDQETRKERGLDLKKIIIFLSVFMTLLLVVFSSEDIYNNSNISGHQRQWKSIDANLVYKISLSSRDQKMTFSRESGVWMMIEPVTSKVDGAKVSALINGISSIKLDSLISSNNKKIPLFQVDESGIEIAVFDNNDEKLESFIIGKPAPGYFLTYLRRSGSDNVYLAKGVKRRFFDNDLKLWRDKRILSFDKSAAKIITIQSKKTAIVFHKEGMTNWLMEEPEKSGADTTTINSILNLLSNFNTDEFEDRKGLKETSLDDPEMEIIIGSKNGELGRVLMGKSEQNHSYIKVPQKKQIFLVQNSRLDNLKKNIQDYKARKNRGKTEKNKKK